MAEEWKTWAFRQKVIHQLEELIRQIPPNRHRNAHELELQVFQRSSTRDEYMQLIARVIMHLRDVSQNNNQQNNNPHLQSVLTAPGPTAQMTGPGGQLTGTVTQMGGQNGPMSGGPGPVVTGQGQMVGTAGPGTQTILTGPQPMQNNPRMGQPMPPSLPNQSNDISNWPGNNRRISEMQLPGNKKQQNITLNTLGNQQGKMNQMQMTITGQGGPTQIGQVSSQIGQVPNQIGQVPNQIGQVPNQMGQVPNQIGQVPNQIGQVPTQMGQVPTQMGQVPTQMGQVPTQIGQVPTQIVPNVGRGGATMQPRVPSPGFSVGVPRQGAPSTSASPAPSLSAPNSQSSPAFISPSPQSNMVPSPAGGNSGNMGRGTSHMGAPSPGGMINTPGQPQQPSPASCVSNSQVEDAAYREKVRQLSKYITPLRRVIERMGKEDEKSRKMKQLYDMLQNPQRRMPMETLLKCELVLVRMDIRDEGGSSAPPSMESRVVALADAVNNAFKFPWGSHTMHRTFSPALSVLLGPTYVSNPTKRFKRDNPLQPPPETPNISDIVQGEVARLNSRFRVNLDCQQPPGSDDLTLTCQLDDPNLPCVPPITLTIPSAYPMKTPRCDLLPVDYETTDFLKNIRVSMLERLQNMPPHCSLTMILHSWEMSVRQACAPKPSLTSIIANAIQPA